MGKPLPPRPPSVPPSAEISGDALDRLLYALGAVTDAVQGLEKKIDANAFDSKIVSQAVKELRTRVDGYVQRIETVERNVRRHDSSFRQTSEVDAKHASELASLVIALDDTRKLAKKSLDKLEQVVREQNAERAETSAQTPVLARVEQQTKGISLPTKAAAALNLLIGVVYLVIEILKSLGKH